MFYTSMVDLLILSTSDNGGPVYKGNGWSG